MPSFASFTEEFSANVLFHDNFSITQVSGQLIVKVNKKQLLHEIETCMLLSLALLGTLSAVSEFQRFKFH